MYILWCVNSKQTIFYLLARSCTEFNSGTAEMIVLFVNLYRSNGN